MSPQSSIRIWRVSGFCGLELLRGTHIQHRFPRHMHETYCIPVLEGGAVSAHYRGQRRVLGKGEFDVINPGEAHTVSPAVEVGFFSYRCFYPSCELLQQIATDVLDRAAPAPMFHRFIHDPELASRLAQVHSRLEHATDVLECATLVHEALAGLIERHAAGPVARSRRATENPLVRRLKAYIDERFAAPITLEELAAIVDRHPVYLVRAFRKQLGLPPHAYQRQVRINRAKRLLAKGEPVGRVAAEVGFADQSHLTRAFKEVIGITPGRYRCAL